MKLHHVEEESVFEIRDDNFSGKTELFPGSFGDVLGIFWEVLGKF